MGELALRRNASWIQELRLPKRRQPVFDREIIVRAKHRPRKSWSPECSSPRSQSVDMLFETRDHVHQSIVLERRRLSLKASKSSSLYLT